MKKQVIAPVIASAFGVLITAGFITTVFLYNQPKQSVPSTPTVVKTISKPVEKPVPPTVDELFRLVNEERAKVGVAPLKLDPLLNKSAQLKAEDMAKNNYFAHSDANGKHGYSYVADVGKRCVYSSENLRDNDEYINTSVEVIDGWKSSKPHYEAMTDSKYESTGFGIAKDKIVEHFCDER